MNEQEYQMFRSYTADELLAMSEEEVAARTAQLEREKRALDESPYEIAQPRTDGNSSDRYRIVPKGSFDPWAISYEQPPDAEVLGEADTDDEARRLLLRMSLAALATEPTEETEMSEPYIPTDEPQAPESYTTRSDAIEQRIAAVLDDPAAYDLDAIFDAAFQWKIDVNDRGQELLDSARYEQVVTSDEFWEIVENNQRAA